MTETERPAHARDRAYMRRALALARRGWGTTAPNPMVGAVVVRDGDVVGEGWHQRFGGPHAEVHALAAAGDRARGATVYVSLEPCAHHGKTPPCADALIVAGVARVVIAVADPNPVAAGGAARLREAGIDVDIGAEAEAARELNAAFFSAASGTERPWITLKLALSIDGALADHMRAPGWLTNARSRREVHRLRAGSDAIAVGIGTVLADDPQLTVRGVAAPRVAPTRIVFDRSARLPTDSALARTTGEAPVLVLAQHADALRRQALETAGVRVLEQPDLESSLTALYALGIRSLFVEGGATLAGALLTAGVVDRLIIFQAPVILGHDSLNAFSFAPATVVGDAKRLRVVSRKSLGDDVMTVYAFD